mmetsp:Transcript_117011/g.174800  ORF Transcript_117011/g.174800 Transcript_117011/m.174800 type:complete len:214 (-) Transcript_117011:149-790(-)
MRCAFQALGHTRFLRTTRFLRDTRLGFFEAFFAAFFAGFFLSTFFTTRLRRLRRDFLAAVRFLRACLIFFRLTPLRFMNLRSFLAGDLGLRFLVTRRARRARGLRAAGFLGLRFALRLKAGTDLGRTLPLIFFAMRRILRFTRLTLRTARRLRCCLRCLRATLRLTRRRAFFTEPQVDFLRVQDVDAEHDDEQVERTRVHAAAVFFWMHSSAS